MARRLALLAVMMSLQALVAIPSAQASGCAHDSWAKGLGWSDNWWVGYNTAGTISCDLNGNYTTGIQRINWHFGYRQSGIDGKYGPGTHQDVRSFQAFWQITVDGLVGPQTWGTYRNRIVFAFVNGGFDVYKIQNQSGPVAFSRDVGADRWYVVGLAGTWKEFWIYGPS